MQLKTTTHDSQNNSEQQTNLLTYLPAKKRPRAPSVNNVAGSLRPHTENSVNFRVCNFPATGVDTNAGIADKVVPR